MVHSLGFPLVAQMVKIQHTMKEIQLDFWVGKIPEGMAAHAIISPYWKIPQEPLGYGPCHHKESDKTVLLSSFTFTHSLQ